ncbi:MAG TPA: serine/threonine-protein kinase, partial [Chthoniobacterales bacterium]
MTCLLKEGLAEDAEPSGESLFDCLAEIDIRDSEWRIGNYEILEEIGRGGMGVIYKARQQHSRRIVALKCILSYHSDSTETVVRFRREAEAVSSLDHPNILPIYEVGEAEGLPFFTMKFAAGGSLQSAKQALRDTPRHSVRLLARVARAVHYAHSEGILHRDLKPANILLDGWREPLVSDFGLAKWLETTSDLTRTLTIFGTPGYIAPEQTSGPAASLKPTADIYSLGAILFDLLAGRPPFLGDHALAVLRQAAERPAPKLRSLVPSLDRDLETICAKCLEREPEARYRTAADLADDLERWLEGRPITARPVGAIADGWRWARRNSKLAASMAACVILAAAGIVWHAENRRLGVSVREAQLAARSVVVLPFIDLDNAQPDGALGEGIATSLEQTLATRGPARVRPLPNAQPWLAGTSVATDITTAAATARARFVLTGTTRNKHGKRRVTVRLLSGSSGELLLKRVFEDVSANSLPPAIESLSADAEAALGGNVDASANSASNDPGLRDPAAREFLISGRQLVFRDTVADSDRAIGCFEQALKLQPNSSVAHAYLASALGGRHHYAPDAATLERAAAEARIAVQLAPFSADAHRALGGVLYQQGEMAAAEEEQLAALEMGGTEERIVSLIGMTAAVR